MASKNDQRIKRKVRIRKKLTGTPERPRLTVFRSLRYVYAQLVDDVNKRTIVSANSLDMDKGGGSCAAAEKVGALVAEKAKAAKIDKVTFDRNGFIYHGVIKALADSARQAGLQF